MTIMSLPNEFLGTNHSFHPENVAPLVIQAAHSNSNFASTPATNNVAQFCGGNFFPNTLGYDVSMLPFLHHTQRPAHFNSPFAQQNKPQPEVSKDEVAQLSTSVNRGANSFNNEVAQSAYWSRQSQLGQFGALSHEIASEQVEEKSPYENVLNAHYIAQSLNNLNQLPMGDGDKKANQQPKNKDSAVKKLPQSFGQQKSMNDMKMFQMQDDMGYRNGVINPQIAKLDQSKLANYKKMSAEVPVSEGVPAARDYRTLKSEASLFNAAAPVVKYSGKASKQFAQKAAVKTNPNSASAVPLMKNQRGASCSPLMAQKMAEFHREDSRSSPLSSDDNMSDQMRYSSPNSVKEQDTVYHNMNAMNNVCHGSAQLTPIIPNYREHQDMNCHMNGNKNKVTSQFSKLPTNSSPNNGAIGAETSQLNRKASYASPYNLFNDQLNQVVLQKRAEKPSERVESQAHPQVAHNPVKMSAHNDINAMLLPKQSPNGSVGYSSVIMRTDRNYETDEKMEKTIRQQRQQPLLWPNNESLKADKVNSYKTEMSAQNQRNLLMGLTERQQSYFDNSGPCQPHVSQNMAQQKCNPKNVLKSMYEGGQQHVMEPAAQQMAQNSDQQQLHHYQQYMPMKLSAPMSQPMLESPDAAEKSFSRKRRSPKTPEYQQARDPPPAHVNMYQQQMQSTYQMESANVNRYEVPNQYYSQSNMQSYNPAAVAEQHHQAAAMTSPGIARMNSGSPMRQMPQVAQTHTLSSYFASAQPHQYASDYEVPSSSPYADPMAHYPSAEVPAYVPNVMSCEAQVDDSRPKVIVPDVEEEFKFLFDRSLPHYKEIARPAEEEALYRNKSAMLYRNNKIDFLTSYMNFLENNCESVESLSDANAVPMKTWNRNKVYQPLAGAEAGREEPKAKPAPAPAKEPAKATAPAVKQEPECNFENDPRYYPLPKSSDKRRLDSSSEDEFDGMPKKAKTGDGAVKKSGGEKPKKKVTFKKDIKTVRIIEPGKKKAPKKEPDEKAKKSAKPEKVKPEKAEKAEKVKPKNEKSAKKIGSTDKTKPKVEKAVAEVKAAKPPVVPPKKRSTKDSSKSTEIEMPRRKVSERKAKDDIKSKIKGAMDSDDELQSSSDSDPSWTPRDDDEESSKRRSIKMRAVRVRVKSPKKSNEQDYEDHHFHPKTGSKKEMKDYSSDSSKASKSSEKSTKHQRFYVPKNQANAKHSILWKLEGDKLQKFEPVDQNGGQCFGSTSVMVKLSDFSLHKYQEVETSVVQVKGDRTIVEICDETDVPTDFKIKENFMKESRCYENQFSVYIQTLVSQALDSNFLNEIVKENDVYFLNNMKVIDDVTRTYLVDLTAVVKWASSSIEVLVKTWPFVSMKSIKNETSASKECAACHKSSCKKTAIFYGHPYQRDTLQGCHSNSIPNNLDKTTDLCSGCAREIILFNKIWHQKYHVFVECAKYVSKKKADDKNKSTTDILNELLADSGWLAKLFYDIRNVWLQIWTIVQKLKGS